MSTRAQTHRWTQFSRANGAEVRNTEPNRVVTTALSALWQSVRMGGTHRIVGDRGKARFNPSWWEAGVRLRMHARIGPLRPAIIQPLTSDKSASRCTSSAGKDTDPL